MELPLFPTLESARLAAEHCRGCSRAATRQNVVFGHGNPNAALMLIGESPSATDDSTGKPFTGPAGRLLDALLSELGLHLRDIWITNLVRCHAGAIKAGRIENLPPRVGEIRACETWLDLELRYVDPTVILAVGAPAARRLIDPAFKLKEQRGVESVRVDGRIAIATIQPAYVMRLATIDPGAQLAARDDLLSDLRLAAMRAGLLPT
ncbi:MAG TPA: uracil-DNA glycosylase [Thermomicrobiales bacterium]|nr:uracil-DNA glycosylase [Thermomicrobiales bacterium]